MRAELPPVTVESCEPCWRDIYGTVATPAIVEIDRRRLIVRDQDRLVVHRRVMFDDHVAGAVCGTLYTHAAVVEIGLGG